ncbi:FecR family protein [Chitinophaga cymbidii]|nr:FecR domain-containing protein [Chitinophaga cymbidii]
MQNNSTNERYQELARKRLSGAISPEEAGELAEWLARDDGHPLEVPPEVAEDFARHEKKIRAGIEKRIGRKSPVVRALRLTAAAAAVLLIITSGYWYFQSGKPVHPPAITVKSNDRLPGGNKAVLTLGNGRQIVLDSAAVGTLYNQGGIQAVKLDSGCLAFNQDVSASPLQFHTLSTPVGGQYRIVLEDGTGVWLNAASSLRFPSSFMGNERVVEITGEAYFEVAKDVSRPFRVNFNGNTVEVLGTHFNIMAYPDEEKSKVTLLEGKVAVSNPAGRRLLQPGMQALIGSTISTRRANVEDAVAWKNGYFIFDNEDIHSIVRKLARWYDVKPAYQGDLTGLTFSGTISRYENVSGVLSMLELTESVRFELTNDALRVSR